jgi:hypothetical protein
VTRVFLSHASADKSAVRRIAESLRAAGHEPWVDEDEILVGESIPTAIERGLREADFVVICLSKAAAERGWVEAERDATLMQQFRERRERILPARLEDVAPPFLIASLAYVDLFPDDEAFERGIARLTHSIKAYEARHTGSPAQPAAAEPELRLDPDLHALGTGSPAPVHAHHGRLGDKRVTVALLVITLSAGAGVAFWKTRTTPLAPSPGQYRCSANDKPLDDCWVEAANNDRLRIRFSVPSRPDVTNRLSGMLTPLTDRPGKDCWMGSLEREFSTDNEPSDKKPAGSLSLCHHEGNWSGTWTDAKSLKFTMVSSSR